MVGASLTSHFVMMIAAFSAIRTFFHAGQQLTEEELDVFDNWLENAELQQVFLVLCHCVINVLIDLLQIRIFS